MSRTRPWPPRLVSAWIGLAVLAVAGRSQEPPPPGAPVEPGERIATADEVRNVAQPAALAFLHVLSYPHRKIGSGMEKGLVAFEEKKLMVRVQSWMDRLRSLGITPKFGGTGEGSGFGGGAIYEIKPAEWNTLQFTGLITFANYQEADIQWNAKIPASKLFLESSYQWRPRENYYGQGHNTSEAWHTNFALRQSWLGGRWEFYPRKRFRFGVLNRWIWTRASQGFSPLFPNVTSIFPSLPGYDSETRVGSTGAYFDADGIRQPYQLGGAIHVGASYQNSFGGGPDLRYFTLETRLEGRVPIVRENSALVGQATFELNRERGGSAPIPFYQQPRIGGSYTLRGYALDRFYGRSLALLSLEYRIRVHPNIQFLPFFDEGQIFDQTSDLSWLNWHRTYGFGIHIRSARGPILRVELGWGGEGTQVHIVFGDREQPPLLGGPIRYGGYKR